ncbi:hypothetical protein [Bacillus sp. NPDC094106]|uniref:hypothetical protein n=1 Tax=Bacillus sp. NPDC094106 TaxID=3363949 RepID=UPI00382839E3
MEIQDILKLKEAYDEAIQKGDREVAQTTAMVLVEKGIPDLLKMLEIEQFTVKRTKSILKRKKSEVALFEHLFLEEQQKVSDLKGEPALVGNQRRIYGECFDLDELLFEGKNIQIITTSLWNQRVERIEEMWKGIYDKWKETSVESSEFLALLEGYEHNDWILFTYKGQRTANDTHFKFNGKILVKPNEIKEGRLEFRYYFYTYIEFKKEGEDVIRYKEIDGVAVEDKEKLLEGLKQHLNEQEKAQ